MKFTLQWLGKFLDLKDVVLNDVVNALTALGLEVDNVIHPSPLLEQFLVAEVLECSKHPNADKLSLCTVNDGTQELTIVCGAPNVRKGLKVVLAPLDATMPGEFKIERRAIRGVESEGMICSSTELELGEDSDGIIELDPSAKVGARLVDECPWTFDTIIEVSLTPNRSDCLGVYGIARDLAAYGIGEMRPLPVTKEYEKDIYGTNAIKVKVENSKACPLFIGREFKGINNTKTPFYLRTLLHSIGEKSISPIVDITNYISYSFNRPLHAFDADKLEGNINVRFAKDNEEMVTLQDETVTLTEDDLVIADDKKACALAGVIGGTATKCTEQTTNIFLEAAVFYRIMIARTGQRTNINTSAKHRFERGVDQDFTSKGVALASAMILECCGGKYSDLVVVGDTISDRPTIELNVNQVLKLGGVSIKEKEIKNILEQLGFESNIITKDKLKVTVPSWRHDVEIPEDLVEEVLRVYGYDKLPATPLPVRQTLNYSPIPQANTLLWQTRSILATLGYNELITWSFMSSKTAEKFDLLNDSVVLSNPISSDLDILRVSLLPNLLTCICKNNARSFHNLSFFEIGSTFKNPGHTQIEMLCGVRSGKTSDENIYKDTRDFDFFDTKSDVLHLLTTVFNIASDAVSFNTSGTLPEWYHPGKSAVVLVDDKVIGYLGELHPTTLKAMDISRTTVAFELLLDAIPYRNNAKPFSISDYQSVQRDFAFVLDKNTSASSLVQAVKSVHDASLIKKVSLFDIFHSETFGPNKKSIAVRVTLQADDRTLDEATIANVSKQIIDSVMTQTKGTLRELS